MSQLINFEDCIEFKKKKEYKPSCDKEIFVYEIVVFEGFNDWNHGGGSVIWEIFVPSFKLVINMEQETIYAFHTDYDRFCLEKKRDLKFKTMIATEEQFTNFKKQHEQLLNEEKLRHEMKNTFEELTK